MRIVEHYSHLNGLEYLMVHKPVLWDEIQQVITSVDVTQFKTKVSKEKTRAGMMLYAPIEMNKEIGAEFQARGWSESRTSYWVTQDAKLIRKTITMDVTRQKEEIEAGGGNPIYSYNQTDFVKERVAVEVQFGKYAFISFDLFVKHMAFFVGDVIDLGIEILPMKALQVEMSSGPGYYEGKLYNLIRQGRGSPAVPLVLIGIAP
ncbi:MAG: restriction endonuclease [Rhodobacteraceae bacterium]|nr:restriction endonuclease [Paracoccaceae bacterium]